jgi:chromosomal replication initiation ATPase DnaA
MGISITFTPTLCAIEKTTKTTEDWTTILTTTLERLHPGAASWLTPLQLLGELENWLIVDAAPQIQTWVERRYLDPLNETAIHHQRAGIRFHTQITLPAPPPRRAASTPANRFT